MTPETSGSNVSANTSETEYSPAIGCTFVKMKISAGTAENCDGTPRTPRQPAGGASRFTVLLVHAAFASFRGIVRARMSSGPSLWSTDSSRQPPPNASEIGPAPQPSPMSPSIVNSTTF